MKKICFITTIPLTLETFVYPTAIKLKETGLFDVTVISSFDDKSINKIPLGFKHFTVKMKRGINLSFLSSTDKLYKIFKKERYDIVQYSTPNASLYASIAAKLANITIRLYAQWGIRYVGFKGIKKFIFKRLERIVCKLSTDIRAVSHLNMDFAITEKLYKKEKAKVVGNGGTIGVDLQVFDVEKKNRSIQEINNKYNLEGYFVFGFVGRLTTDKGAKELLKSFSMINEEKERTKLMVVGPFELEPKLMKLLSDNKISRDIIFTGFIDKIDLYKFYSRFDCFVHPTYREGFGLVIQEAGAMALPIITTNVNGASEVMDDNVSCVLVKPKDSVELYEAMKKIMFDSKLRSNLSNNALIKTREFYSQDSMIRNQLNDYLHLIR